MKEMSTVAGFWDNATNLVATLDNQFLIIHIILVILMLTVLLPMFYFIIKYSAKRFPKEKAENFTHHTGLEIAWTVIPTILLMVIFYYGYNSLENLRTLPNNGTHIKVVGKMWSWTFEYPDGRKTDKLYVPKGENIILDMTAPRDDVIHSLWIPAFRQKEDVVPGRTTHLWFNSNKLGSYDIECTEYCGDRHSFMLSKVIVIEPLKYNDWLKSDASYPGSPSMSSEPIGKTLLTNNGCTSCHSLEDMTLVGPGFKGIVGRSVKTNNGIKISDYKYLKDAILNPDKDIVDGFSAGMMPSSQGVLNDKDINEIVKYLKTLH